MEDVEKRLAVIEHRLGQLDADVAKLRDHDVLQDERLARIESKLDVVCRKMQTVLESMNEFHASVKFIARAGNAIKWIAGIAAALIGAWAAIKGLSDGN